MRVLYTSRREHEPAIRNLLERRVQRTASREIRQAVMDIMDAVAARGDEALSEYQEQFHGYGQGKKLLRLPVSEIDRVIKESVDPEVQAALEHAAQRIRLVHERQHIDSFGVQDALGIRITEGVRPLRRIGIMASSQKPAHLTSVLMAAIPARIAGVTEIAIATPGLRDKPADPYVLAAARIAGISEVYRVWGAQAVAAFAYGTATIPRVDKIVGPGDMYVNVAKQLAFGQVGIDLPAGPGDLIIFADSSADPVCVAADILAQIEHDDRAIALILIINQDKEFDRQVLTELRQQNEKLPRWKALRGVIQENCAMIVCNGEDQAVEIANHFAPQQVLLNLRDPNALLPRLQNAGVIYVGNHVPQALGDSVAGSNNILPTGGASRFLSSLSVYDFLKRTTVVQGTREGLEAESQYILAIAKAEGMEAHSRAVKARLAAP